MSDATQKPHAALGDVGDVGEIGDLGSNAADAPERTGAAAAETVEDPAAGIVSDSYGNESLHQAMGEVAAPIPGQTAQEKLVAALIETGFGADEAKDLAERAADEIASRKSALDNIVEHKE